MVTLAKAREYERENLILLLRHINSSLVKIKPSSRIERWECEAIGQAIDKLHLDLIHNEWMGRLRRLRSLNLAMRAIIYDLLEENPEKSEIFDIMLESSLKFEEIVANLE